MKTFMVLLVAFLLLLHIGHKRNVAGQSKNTKCRKYFCITLRGGNYYFSCQIFPYTWRKERSFLWCNFPAVS
ncbi:unnamed protein product [Clavelina lepadiformis]|uniref:Uncharacterized protein n=1 Tax=Clavelina lepadiformis TaxID=159417 RepID=A0ABP0EYX3_CLALP